MSDTTVLKSKKQKKQKKELSPKQQKVKRILNWIVNIICVLMILFALFIAVMTITRTAGDRGVANIFGTAFMPVQSDSMSGTFEEDDLILTKIYKGDGSDLKVGQVITFRTSARNTAGEQVYIYNTHRIVEVVVEGKTFRTQGDNEASPDVRLVTVDNVVATWGSVDADGNPVDGKNWGQVGAAINWLQGDKTHYFLAIVLPLILLFVIYAFILVRTLIINKMSKPQSAGDIAAVLSDEEKRQLVAEFLAAQQAANAVSDAPNGGGEAAEAKADGKAENIESQEVENIKTEAGAEQPTAEESNSSDGGGLAADIDIADDIAQPQALAEEISKPEAAEPAQEAKAEETPKPKKTAAAKSGSGEAAKKTSTASKSVAAPKSGAGAKSATAKSETGAKSAVSAKTPAKSTATTAAKSAATAKTEAKPAAAKSASGTAAKSSSGTKTAAASGAKTTTATAKSSTGATAKNVTAKNAAAAKSGAQTKAAQANKGSKNSDKES